MKSPTQRFSDRVDDYLRCRPHYPAAMLAHLVQHCGCSPYEHLLQTYAPDYKAVRARLPNPEQLATFYRPGSVHSALFPNQQSFDEVGLYGRMMSSSYIPKPGEPQHLELRQALQDPFNIHQSQGQVQFHYQTALYYGQLA